MSGQPSSQPSAQQPDSSSASSTTPWVPVLIFGCLILIISFGVRSGFGLFLPEMTAARGWSRELFSLSIAIQNLAWAASHDKRPKAESTPSNTMLSSTSSNVNPRALRRQVLATAGIS